MANLKDYISGLVTSVTTARFNADAQSAEIARKYRSDNILCNFPIPRMRIGDIEIELPYALNFQNSSNNGLVLDEQRTFQAMRLSLCNSYNMTEIPTHDIKLYTTLNNDLEDCARIIIRGIKSDGQSYFEKIKELYDSHYENWCGIMEKLDGKTSLDKDEIIQDMHNQVLLSLQSTDFSNLEVIAEADKLSSYDSRVITRMKIKIQEDGLVWANTANGEILVSE